MMLGFLLARAGVDVVVLEKHADFLRDFRGDTIHPSTLEIMYELGILDDFLKRPHQEVRALAGQIGDERVVARRFLASADALPLHRFDAAMGLSRFSRRAGAALSELPPQDAGARVTDLSSSDGRVLGRQAETPDGPLEIRADLVVGADGRHSDVRDARRARGRGFRRADGRALVPPLEARERRPAIARPHPGRRGCSSRSTAAIIGNAPMSSRKAASSSSAAGASKRFARP